MSCLRQQPLINSQTTGGKLAGIAIGIFFVLSLFSDAVAHKGESHIVKKEDDPSTHAAKEFEKALIKINDAYVVNVKPIFKKSCFDCHSSETQYPWYAHLPLAKTIVDSDIKEAKAHLDMSKDFPFSGHATPLEDLMEIEKEISQGKMPPFRYKMMHWKSQLICLPWFES